MGEPKFAHFDLCCDFEQDCFSFAPDYGYPAIYPQDSPFAYTLAVKPTRHFRNPN